MADPTLNLVSSTTALPAFSVKPCTGPYQQQSVATIGQSQSALSAFSQTAGKIGDLQVLNSIGAGGIGSGLRLLANASNSIRTGCGALPNSIGSTIEGGANWVLSHMGLSSDMVSMLQDFHPAAANLAWGNAQQIFQQIQSGHFKASDIPGYLQSFQSLESLARGIYTPANGSRAASLSPHCQAFPYAEDLLPRAPKYKFLFLVQFKLMPGFVKYQSAINNMAFVVKKSTRPHVKYATEDVNFYNFRSKVVTKTEFDEMTMSFHDDNQGMTHTFFATYLRALSPILNNQGWISPDMLETQGMNFPNKKTTGPNYSASLGPLPGDSKQQYFQEITLYHVVDYGRNVDVYHFYNPRVSQIQLDDVDMAESGTLSELTMSFNYDYMEITNVPASSIDFIGLQPGATYPMTYNGGAGQAVPQNGLNPYGTTTTPDSCNNLQTQNTSSSSSSGPFGSFGSTVSSGINNISTSIINDVNGLF